MDRRTLAVLVVVLLLAGAGYWWDTTQHQQSAADFATTTPMLDADLFGTWQSTDDANFVRQFNDDGSVTDSYKGDDSATETGTWKVVDSSQVASLGYGDLSSTTVVAIAFPGEDTLYFSLASVSSDSLSLTYLDRGNTLNFTKVQ